VGARNEGKQEKQATVAILERLKIIDLFTYKFPSSEFFLD